MSACTKNSKEQASETRTLVAYFSATGTTKEAAAIVAKVTGADLYEIEPKVAYTSADLDWTDKSSRSSVEMKDKNSRPEIKAVGLNMSDYDVIYIGYPIWWYVAPTIINTFIESVNLEGKAIYPFATSGGSPIGPTVDALKKTYPNLDIRKGALLNNPTEKSVRSWVENK